MILNVINGKDQIIDAIDVDDCYITADYVKDCLQNGMWDDSTLEEFNHDIAGMALQNPDTGKTEDWLCSYEEEELREIFLKRKGEWKDHVE